MTYLENIVYLDNSSTTLPCDEAIKEINSALSRDFGNPSSLHTLGFNAEKRVTSARQAVADMLCAIPDEIYFTSGGTEGNNTALSGAAYARRKRGNRIVTTAIEHPSVLEVVKRLESEGFEVIRIKPAPDGTISEEDIFAAVNDKTILVSIMLVNNETGAILPVSAARRAIDKAGAPAILHCDAVQAFGKMPINAKTLGADIITASAHKIHGPKGVGFLYINEGTKINPVIFGGGQQKGMRSGTENVPGIAGMSRAAEMIYDSLEDNIQKLFELKSYFIRELLALSDVTVNGLPEDFAKDPDAAVQRTAPHIVSASFANVRAEVLLHALEAKGIYVSSGSACSSNRPAKSKTLTAIGIDQKLLDSTLRFSMSVETTKEEIDETLEVLSKELPGLRRYMRR